jgi:hypothetical protein
MEGAVKEILSPLVSIPHLKVLNVFDGPLV